MFFCARVSSVLADLIKYEFIWRSLEQLLRVERCHLYDFCQYSKFSRNSLSDFLDPLGLPPCCNQLRIESTVKSKGASLGHRPFANSVVLESSSQLICSHLAHNSLSLFCGRSKNHEVGILAGCGHIPFTD